MMNKEKIMTETPRFLSCGFGLQSTVIGEMSARGDLPKCTVIHADTGWERQATKDIRDFYAARWRSMGLDVHILAGQDIRRDGAKEHIHMPFWTDAGGPLRRQCTYDFKLVPIKRKVRECLGFDPSKPPHPKPGAAIIWLGITVDEWTRAKPSRIKFMENRYPLLVAKMDRQDCTAWLQDRDLPVPVKSACIGCPYRRASEWIDIRENVPNEWQQAVEFDEVNRNNPLAERDAGNTADELYIWREAEPLAEADLDNAAKREKQRYGTQLPMFACESGFCGV
ncbi:unnamed protein product [marine sediment metagenome]|uniref:Phosphoadenosine phosphosulphate reductase domain-containing protein n=1 Tax=marine sediment metagenome TaxID=412755 RepID=X1CA90_9ZZZZ